MRQIVRMKSGSIIELNSQGLISVTSSNPAWLSAVIAGPVVTVSALVAGSNATLIFLFLDGSVVVRPVSIF